MTKISWKYNAYVVTEREKGGKQESQNHPPPKEKKNIKQMFQADKDWPSSRELHSCCMQQQCFRTWCLPKREPQDLESLAG